MDIVLNLMVSLLITVVAYCTVPVILRIKNGKYEYEKGKKIVLRNCIIVCVFFVCVRLSQGAEQVVSPAVFLYYYINKAILVKPKENIEDDDLNEKNIKKEIKKDNNIVIKNEEYNVDKEDVQKKEVKNGKNIFKYMFFISIFIIIIMGIYILNLSKDNNEDKKTSSGKSSLSSSKNYFLNEEGEVYVIEENGVKVYNASHILVDDKATAEQIILKLNKGEKFEDLMNEYYGEHLGNFYEGVMVEEFEEAVDKLEVNEYTKEPIKSEYGYHIILRNKPN